MCVGVYQGWGPAVAEASFGVTPAYSWQLLLNFVDGVRLSQAPVVTSHLQNHKHITSLPRPLILRDVL